MIVICRKLDIYGGYVMRYENICGNSRQCIYETYYPAELKFNVTAVTRKGRSYSVEIDVNVPRMEGIPGN